MTCEQASHTREIIVIGAGLGGLASAAFAARAGARVRLLDSANHPGGRARSRVQEQFTLNVGPHALYRRGPAERALRELGVPIAGRTLKKSGAYALIDDQLHELPTDMPTG
jgi:phytoene dehydrogenase-like protein